MANNALTEYLQFHGQESKIGCLTIAGSSQEGRIYIQHGAVVCAETTQCSGLLAFFSMLGWKESSTIEWKEDVPSPRILFNETIDTLLFQYAQLEDSGQTDEASLQSLFPQTDQQEISLRELKSYIISFEILNAEFNGTTHTLSKPVTLVGRGDDCDFIIPDGTVSTHHASIIQETNCIRITDLGSTNGTFINGSLISSSILQVGDELIVGQIMLRMSMKMQRHLLSTGDTPSSAVPAASADSQERKASTLKIDAAMLRKKLADSGFQARPKGPITWKNIDEMEKTKPVATSIFSRFFKK